MAWSGRYRRSAVSIFDDKAPPHFYQSAVPAAEGLCSSAVPHGFIDTFPPCIICIVGSPENGLYGIGSSEYLIHANSSSRGLFPGSASTLITNALPEGSASVKCFSVCADVAGPRSPNRRSCGFGGSLPGSSTRIGTCFSRAVSNKPSSLCCLLSLGFLPNFQSRPFRRAGLPSGPSTTTYSRIVGAPACCIEVWRII